MRRLEARWTRGNGGTCTKFAFAACRLRQCHCCFCAAPRAPARNTLAPSRVALLSSGRMDRGIAGHVGQQAASDCCGRRNEFVSVWEVMKTEVIRRRLPHDTRTATNIDGRHSNARLSLGEKRCGEVVFLQQQNCKMVKHANPTPSFSCRDGCVPRPAIERRA